MSTLQLELFTLGQPPASEPTPAALVAVATDHELVVDAEMSAEKQSLLTATPACRACGGRLLVVQGATPAARWAARALGRRRPMAELGHGRRHCQYCYRPCTDAFCSDRRARYAAADGPRCIYCNEPAQERDHFPPRAARRGLTVWHPIPDLVPACADCNQIKSDREFATIREARDHIARWLRRKHARLLAGARGPVRSSTNGGGRRPGACSSTWPRRGP
jgi:5-methylcytosine-specific restriction endonuclease McrA